MYQIPFEIDTSIWYIPNFERSAVLCFFLCVSSDFYGNMSYLDMSYISIIEEYFLNLYHSLIFVTGSCFSWFGNKLTT